jgi:hypothetical protein
MAPHAFNSRRARWAAAVVVCLLGQACASSGGGGGGGGSGGTGDVITREMIGEPGNENAYTIVRRLRPRWLSPRTQGTIVNPNPSFPEVYLDNVRYGPIDSLYRIDAVQIDRIEFLSALDATTRFGMGHDGGAIIVRTINAGPG